MKPTIVNYQIGEDKYRVGLFPNGNVHYEVFRINLDGVEVWGDCYPHMTLDSVLKKAVMKLGEGLTIDVGSLQCFHTDAAK